MLGLGQKPPSSSSSAPLCRSQAQFRCTIDTFTCLECVHNSYTQFDGTHRNHYIVIWSPLSQCRTSQQIRVQVKLQWTKGDASTFHTHTMNIAATNRLIFNRNQSMLTQAPVERILKAIHWSKQKHLHSTHTNTPNDEPTATIIICFIII